MNESSSNDPSNLAKQRLAQACRAMDKSARLGWVMMGCEILLLVLLALALADYWLMLSSPLRAIGALCLASLVVFGLVRLVRFVRKPTQLKQGALEIESSRPELGCEVSTAAEYLAGERKIEHEYEPELAAALEANAARALTFSPVATDRNIAYALLLALTSIVCLILLLIAPGGLTALQRAAVPFSQKHYTSVEVLPGNLEVPVGHNVSITNIFSGRLPKSAQFAWLQNTNVWQRTALTANTNGLFVHTLTNLQSDLTYRVSGNDALSPDYTITTYVPPTVREFDIRLSYPAYTQLPPVDQKSPEISAVRATTAQIHIQPSVPLKEAKLRFSNQPELAFADDGNGSWSATVPVSKDSEYWIALTDLKGHPGVNDTPYHIKALRDNPPKVEITDPGKDTRSSATNMVLVKISVSDDFGVGQIKVVFNKLGGSQQTIPAERVSENKNEVVAKAELDLSTLDLKEYELLAYHAEATDNNTLDGPGIGKSPVYFIEITDEEASTNVAQGQNQKVNLLVIQKQIIADTTAMASAAPVDKYKELTARQRDAADLGRMYSEAISDGGAEAAKSEMNAAITDMELAGKHLEKQDRSQAIPKEESALAHLYQVVKLMPELENLPTNPSAAQQTNSSPKVQVVLEAIKQKKKEQPDNKEIEEALNQAKDLARAQSGLNTAMRHPANGSGTGQGQMAGQGDAKAPGQKGEPGKPAEQKQQMADQKAPGQKGQAGQANAKGQGEGSGNGEGQNEASAENDTPSEQTPPEETPAQIAQKEDQLSQEAAALADLLQRLAGKDKRLGHNLGAGAGRASAKMAAAGQAMKQGRADAAGEHGFQGELALKGVIDQLERVIKNQPDASDIAHEDAPKEYETLISEYLKKLSHAE